MAKNKTAETDASVIAFINSFVKSEQKKEDSLKLIGLMKKWSGFEPKMWGPSIIGFGSVHYRYASGHEGDMPLLGFSPRKAAFSLYVTIPEKDYDNYLKDLGKFKIAKACIYFNKLSDLHLDTLEKICKTTIKYTLEKWPAKTDKGQSKKD